MYEQILAHVARTITLTLAEQQLFVSLLKPRTLKKHQFVIQAGEPCRYDTYVVQGCVRMFYSDPDGQAHTLQFAAEDWWVVDAESFTTGAPATYDAQALEDCQLLQIDCASMEILCRAVPAFERFWRLAYQRGYGYLQRRIVAGLSLSAEARYQDFAHRYPGLHRRVPLGHLAAYLGITPEFLSRLRRRRASKSVGQ